MTSTLNRVMVVELALPALVPGLLVAIHYAVQVLRPRWGYGSDRTGRRTPWIVGGMAALCLGGFGGACGTALAQTHLAAGLALAAVSFSSSASASARPGPHSSSCSRVASPRPGAGRRRPWSGS